MYLRHLWVLNYKNLVRQGFSFDPTLAVQYEASTGVLTIQQEPSLVPNLFFGPCVPNVTGILGANGAGKSTLLEFIQRLVGSFQDDSSLLFEAHHEAIVILDNYVLYHESLRLNRRRSTTAGFTLIPYRESIGDNVQRLTAPNDRYRCFYEFALVAYSNHYETSIDNENLNVIDVSTSHLLNSTIWRQQLVGRSGPAAILEFESQEFQTEINLLRYLADNGLASEIPFALPPTIGLQVLEPEEALPRLKVDEEQWAAYPDSPTAGWQRQLGEDFRPNQHDSPFEEFRQRLISLHLLALLRRYPQQFGSLSPETRTALRTLQVQGVDLPDDVLEGLRGVKRFIDYLQVEQQAGRLQVIGRRSDYREIIYDMVQLQPAQVEGQRLIERITELNRLSALTGIRTTRLRWSGLSTGQVAYLRLYARFYLALTRLRDRNNDRYYQVRQVLVLVDEGEANFHPQWQKQFMNVLLGILNTFFAEFTIQLIICSNSPFIASDIPKTNLILLQRNEQGLGEVLSWAGREQTFAANIHSLLTDSFFLQGGLLGDFAKRKLDELLRYLATPASASVSPTLNPTQARQLIDLVGEPVIRLKLEELWRARFGAEDELARLRQRIQELEQRPPRRD